MSRALLQTVLSFPTAPFHEDVVAKFVIAFAVGLGLKPKIDGYGNIHIHYKKGKGRVPLLFLAHMDHPGFRILKTTGNQVSLGILGAGGIERLLPKSSLRLKYGDQWAAARITALQKETWKGRPIVLARLDKAFSPDGLKGEFGYLDFPPVAIKGELLYTKAADDLANVASILSLLERLVRQKTAADVMLVFTCAEEVGFVGMTQMLRAKLIPKNRISFVCESSSANYGGITIGGGATLRVGDRSAAYSPHIDYWVRTVAMEKKLPIQRALLSGGQCEACVFALNGYSAGCLIIPLGNYHNIRDDRKKTAPEYISLRDYDGIIALMLAICEAKGPDLYLKAFNKKLDQHVKKWR